MMFLQHFLGQKKYRKLRAKRVDVVETQVKDILQKTDQKIILMVRG